MCQFSPCYVEEWGEALPSNGNIAHRRGTINGPSTKLPLKGATQTPNPQPGIPGQKGPDKQTNKQTKQQQKQRSQFNESKAAAQRTRCEQRKLHSALSDMVLRLLSLGTSL